MATKKSDVLDPSVAAEEEQHLAAAEAAAAPPEPVGAVFLRWVGDGSRSVNDVPMRDVWAPNPDTAARLVATGLYEVATPPA